MTTAGRMTLATRQLEIPTKTSIGQNRSRIGSLRFDSIGTSLWESFEGARSPPGDLRRISRTLGRIGTRRDRSLLPLLLLEPARRGFVSLSKFDFSGIPLDADESL